MNVSSDFIMKGAVYALEQSGLLLNDAVTLMDKKSYNNGIVLAAFAREELGRSQILMNLFDDVVKNGKNITADDINKACNQHMSKQEYGQISTVLRFQNDTEEGKLFMKKMKLIQDGNQESADYRENEVKLNEIMAQVRKRTPGERHRHRLKALYVMPDDKGTGWNIPKNISPEFARDFIIDTSNDYSAIRQHFYSDSRSDETEFIKEVRKWGEKPELPLPTWPKWPS